MRPKVFVNFAMSADGKMALPDGRQTAISNTEDLERVHKMRHEVDAIMVGVNTVITDDPKLTVKQKYVSEPVDPVRVVVDTTFRTPASARVLDGTVDSIMLTGELDRTKVASPLPENVGIVSCGLTEDGKVNLSEGLRELSQMGVETLMVEGGGTLIESMIRKGLVDEMTIYVGSIFIGGKDAPTPGGGKGAGEPEQIVGCKLESVEKLGDGVLLKYVFE